LFAFVQEMASVLYRVSARRVLVGAAVGSAFLTCRHFVSAAAKKSDAAAPAPVSTLDPKEFRKFRLSDVSSYNHNTKQFRIDIPGQGPVPVASFLLARAEVDGKELVRPYTPVESAEGKVELLIKIYPNGPMTSHIGKLKQNDFIELKGPMEKFKYDANSKKKIGMLAAGTGITPMLQVLNKIASNPKDQTEVVLLFFNTTPDDVLLKEKLDALASKTKRIKVVYSVDNPKGDWKGKVGLVNDALVKETMPPPSADNLILVCGPPGFMNAVSGQKAKDYTQGELSGILQRLGYTGNGVFKY